MWSKLFYDKYGGDHHFNNVITREVTVNDLEDGSFTFYQGEDALKIYNSKFTGYFAIPEFLLTSDLYQLNVYTKVINGIETVYTIVNVNTHILEFLVENKLEIPEVDFLKNLCRYHLAYMNSNKLVANVEFSDHHSITEKIKRNTIYITDKAITATDYTTEQKINDPKELHSSTQLYEFQKCSIFWMQQKELNLKKISYNMNEENVMGNVYYDTYEQIFNLLKNRKSLTFKGAALIDEVGLGKTLQMLMLSLLNQSNDTDYISNIDDTKLHSRATLVLCPNQLCGQWIREIKSKIDGKTDINVVQLLTKRDADKYTYQDLLDADFVIVSYTFLDNKVATAPWTNKISTIKTYHKQAWSVSEVNTVKDTFKTMGTDLRNSPIDSLASTNPLIQLIYWHRIIVDEFHEVYSNKKYVYMKNLMPHMRSKYRWAVTATPFITNTSLYEITDFLTDYKNPDGMNILSNEQFVDYLSTDCFRRNTKASVESIEQYKLPPVEEEIMWLKFTATERMMYNAFLANPNNDKYSVYLRQLCCHPQLADETKLALSNCKTLAEIEKMMIAHYKNEMDEAQVKVDKVNDRITKIKKKIRKVKRKQKAAQLRKAKLQKAKLNKLSPKAMKDLEREIEKEIKKELIKEFGEDSDDENNDENDKDDKDDDLDIAMLIAGLQNGIDIDAGANVPQAMPGFATPKSSITLENLEESLQKLELKLKETTGILEGKKTTFNFFNNVIERLRKTVTNDEDKMAKAKKEVELNETDILDLYARANCSDSESESDSDEEQCGICLDEIPSEDVGVTKCGHIFCYECLKITISKYHNCPYCKQKLNDNEIYILSFEKKKKVKLTSQEKKDEDLINEVGTKLANLIFFLRNTDEHTIIFSQWDDLLRRVGRILSDNGIRNVFCKGNCYQRDKAIREFNSDTNVKVIMLSSENTASGTNLTKASRIILLEPIYGSYKYRKDQERQAIGRAHRMGQKNIVKVVRFLIRNSVEEDIYLVNSLEDNKHAESKNIKIKEINV